MNRYLTLLILAAVLFAACQPAAGPTNTPAPVNIDPTQPPATDVPATPVPPTGVPAAPATLPPGSSNPTIQVVGDLSASVEADNFYVAPVKAEDETTIIGTMLYLNQGDTRIVFIRFPKDATPGTYPILQGFTENFDGTTATGNYIDQTSDPAGQFAATEGTLTLDSTGDSFSGTFEFTAVGLEDTPEQGQTVTVSGAFANIPPQ